MSLRSEPCPTCHKAAHLHFDLEGNWSGCPETRAMIRRWGGSHGQRNSHTLEGRGRLDIGIAPGTLVAIVDDQREDGAMRVVDLFSGGEWWLPLAAMSRTGATRPASVADVEEGKHLARMVIPNLRIVRKLMPRRQR